MTPLDATACTHRDAQFVMNVHGRWTDPALDRTCIGWARDLFRAAEPFATRYDPTNLFCMNQNIRPTVRQ